MTSHTIEAETNKKSLIQSQQALRELIRLIYQHSPSC
jgi:hypothetical protein